MKYKIFIGFCIVAGIVMRLIWMDDMEWKGDEQWMYEHAMATVNTGHWDNVGIESSAGIVNPGLSVWMFVVIGFFCSTPVDMAYGVGILNVLVLLGFLFFVIKKIKAEEKEMWFWTLALAAVSPLAVLFSRKIWEQDVVVLFSLLTIVGNSYRNKRWGALLWGIAGAMAGQVHMSGFFYAFGLFVFSFVYDKINANKTQYWWWLAGSLVGSIGLLPWLNSIINHPHPSELSWAYLLQFSFYFYFLIDALGLNIMYSIRDEFWQFIKLPIYNEVPLYLLALIHLLLVAVGLYSIKRIFTYAKNNYKVISSIDAFKNYLKQITEAEFYLLSILLGLGVFMNFNGAITFQHYLIVGFPFSYLFLTKILFRHKKLLVATIVAQFIITVFFLVQVHVHNGFENANYGKTYRFQISHQ